MRYIHLIFKFFTKTKLRKILSSVLAALILLTSIRFVFFSPKDALAADILLGFDEGYGSSASDTNSTITASTITNAVWRTEDLCKVGKCLYFDGAGDYVSHADDANLDMGSGNTVTIEGWFRTGDITSGTRTLISKEEATGADGGYRIDMNSSGFLVFGIDNDNTSFPSDSVTSTAAYDDNKWHHFAAVKDAGNSLTLYIDAMSVGTPDASPAADVSNDDSFYIGTYYDGSSTNAWLGFIDEVKVLRTARTATEIKADYLGETPSRGTSAQFGPDNKWLSNGLVGYWKMDENTGTSTTDSSGNGNTGTLQTSPATPTWASGKYGPGLSFDGGDYVLAGTGTSITNLHQSAFTVSVWIYPTANPGLFEVHEILSKGSSVDKRWSLNIWNQSGTIRFRGEIDNASAQYGWSLSNESPTLNQWQLITMIYNDTGDRLIHLFLNGNELTYSSQIPFSSTQSSDAAYQLAFGSESNGSDYFEGRIDEARLYNRALSPKEVADLYNFAPGPVGWWKLDENTGTSANDSSGNNYTSTLGGGTAVRRPTWTSGKFGPGLNLTQVTSNNTLTLQPDATAGIDTAIAVAFPNNNFETNTGIGIRGDTRINGLIKFDLTSIPAGATITSATLYMYAQSINSSRTESVNRILSANSAWTEAGATWNYAVASTTRWAGDTGNDGGSDAGASVSGTDYSSTLMGSWAVTSGAAANTEYTISLDATEVSSMVSANNGMILRSPTSDFNANDYNSSDFATAAYRPKLVIDYTTLVGQYITTNNQSIIIGNGTTYNNLSWGGWVSPSTSAVSRTMLHKGNEFRLATNASSQASCSIYSGSWQTAAVSSNALPLNTWSYVMCTYDGANIKVFVNGVQTGSVAETDNITSTNSTALNVGRDADDSTYFIGNIDDVRIYNYARTSKQIIEDMNGGHPSPGSPVGSYTSRWKLDDMTGTTAQDESTNNNDLTLSTATWTTSGKFDGAFDGATNRRLSITNDSDFEPAASEDFSISMWIKSDGVSAAASEYIANMYTSGEAGYRLSVNTSEQAVCEIDDDTVSFPEDTATGTTNVYDSNWHHVVCVRDITQDKLYLYVDGRLDGQDTDLSATGAIAGTQPLYFGDENATDGTDEFLGDLDDIKFFRSALSPSEVLLDMNFGSSATMGGVADHTSEGFAGNPPVGWWKMDENTSTNANDSSGNANTGTITNSPSWTSGKHGSGLSLAGSNQHITIADGSQTGLDFAASSAFTLETWFKHGPATAVETLISKLESSGTDGGYKLKMEADGDITCETDDDDADTTIDDTATTTAATYDDAGWHHVACVYDVTNTDLLIYIDGIFTASDTTITTNSLANDDAFFYGIEAATGTEDWVGQLDEMRIYNYARTQAQIAYDYNRGAPIAWYKMDECSGGTVYNATLNGNGTQYTGIDGTINLGTTGTQTTAIGNGTCSASAQTPRYNGRNGKYSSSVNLDGTSDYIGLPTNTELDLTAYSPSIALWFNTSTSFPGGAALYNDYGVGGVIATSISIDSDGNLNADYRDSGSDTINNFGTAVVTNGSWHQAVFVKTSATTTSLYLDGKLETSGTNASFNNETFVGGALPALGRNTLYDTAYFSGQIDDVRIYNYALSADQVKRLYNEGSAVQFAPLTGSP